MSVVNARVQRPLVAFSGVDYQSHEADYPALLDLAKGMPVGALVFGTNAIEAVLWMHDGERLSLEYALVVGNTMRQLLPAPRPVVGVDANAFDRQIGSQSKVVSTDS